MKKKIERGKEFMSGGKSTRVETLLAVGVTYPAHTCIYDNTPTGACQGHASQDSDKPSTDVWSTLSHPAEGIFDRVCSGYMSVQLSFHRSTS